MAQSSAHSYNRFIVKRFELSLWSPRDCSNLPNGYQQLSSCRLTSDTLNFRYSRIQVWLSATKELLKRLRWHTHLCAHADTHVHTHRRLLSGVAFNSIAHTKNERKEEKLKEGEKIATIAQKLRRKFPAPFADKQKRSSSSSCSQKKSGRKW